MRSPVGGALRWVRSAALTLAIVGLSTTAHVAAGGTTPTVSAVVVLTVLCALVSVLLTGRRLGVTPIAAVLSGMQVVMHEGLMLIGTSSCQVPAAWSHAMAHGEGTLAIGSLCAMPGHPLAMSETMRAFSSPAMLLGHVIATGLLVAWLCVGERALWMLASRLTRPVPTGRAATTRARLRVLIDRPAASMPGLTLGRGTGLRGPPSPRTGAVPA